MSNSEKLPRNAQAKTIKNIIFDLGNVLLSFKPWEYVSAKVAEEEKASQVYKEIFLSQEWLMLDRGAIGEEEAIRRMCARNPALSPLIKLTMTDWYEMLTPLEDVVVYLEQLKDKGYKIYYLSNYQLLAYNYVYEKYSFFKSFDGGIISFKEKLLKPEPDIYKKLIAAYGLDPAESIFIDDTRENIDAAGELGFHALHFTGSQELKKQLSGYNVRL